MENKQKWYFTFGSDKNFPFRGGWVEVSAESRRQACAIFRSLFPDRPDHEGTLNCSDVYSEEKFLASGMADGNLGHKCHLRIDVIVSQPIAEPRPSPFERTRAAVYATGNRWAKENFDATH